MNEDMPSVGAARLRQIANLVLAIAQLIAIIWNSATGAGLDPDVRSGFETPVFPAPYTFAIWLIIYPGALVYAVYQALPTQRFNPLLMRMGWWTAGAFLALTLWATFQALGWLWLTVGCVLVMFVTLWKAFHSARTQPNPTPSERAFALTPIGVFFGYITAATVLSVALVLPRLIPLWGISPSSTGWAVFVLLAACVLASGIVWQSRGDLTYALTIVWSLMGIAVQNVVVMPNTLVAVMASGAILVILGTLLAAHFLKVRDRVAV